MTDVHTGTTVALFGEIMTTEKLRASPAASLISLDLSASMLEALDATPPVPEALSSAAGTPRSNLTLGTGGNKSSLVSGAPAPRITRNQLGAAVAENNYDISSTPVSAAAAPASPCWPLREGSPCQSAGLGAFKLPEERGRRLGIHQSSSARLRAEGDGVGTLSKSPGGRERSGSGRREGSPVNGRLGFSLDESEVLGAGHQGAGDLYTTDYYA
jgi:hypothetical protein